MQQLGASINGRLVGRRMSVFESDIPEPRTTETGIVAPSSSLIGVIKNKLAGKLTDDPGIRFGDGSFYLPTVREVTSILEASEADRRTWMQDRFDCDDFAYVLKGEMSVHAYKASNFMFALCVGIAWGDFDWIMGYHAVNWFIANDGELHFIEPQSDSIYDASHCSGQVTLLLA